MDLYNKLKINTCCTNDDKSAGVYIIRDKEKLVREYDIKTTKIGSDFSIQELIENDILGDVRKKLMKEVSESYDNLAFFALAPYGITGENWRENVDRVCIVSQTFSKHFYVDDMYAFSIVTFVDYSEFDEKHEFKLTLKYRIEIFEDMIGQRTK